MPLHPSTRRPKAVSRPARPLVPTEDQEQKALVRWLDFKKLLFTHAPNGGARHIATARRLKSLGLKAGVPDILIFTPPPSGKGVGVALELKRVGVKTASIEQQRWIKSLQDCGWMAKVVSGAEAAIAWLTELGY